MATEVGLKPAGGSIEDLYANRLPHNMIAGSLRFVKVTIEGDSHQWWSGELDAGNLQPNATYTVKTPPTTARDWDTASGLKRVNTELAGSANIKAGDKFTLVSKTTALDIDHGTALGAGSEVLYGSTAYTLESIIKGIQMRATISMVGSPNNTTGIFQRSPHDDAKDIQGVDQGGEDVVRFVLENNGHSMEEFASDIVAAFGGATIQTEVPGQIRFTRPDATTGLDQVADIKVEEICF